MANLNALITVFEGFNRVIGNISVFDFLDDVKKNNDPLVRKIREHYKAGHEKSVIDHLKKQLKAVTFSGVYKGGRKIENLIEYNNLVILDFDGLNEKLLEVRYIVNRCKYTLACFLSPKGNGLKVLVSVHSTMEMHSEIYLEVASHYSGLTKCELDQKCKDVGRLCFYSYDPDLIIFPSAVTFYSQKNTKNSLFESPQTCYPPSFTNESALFFEQAERITTAKISYEEGNRNNFIFSLACNCNRYGIPLHEAKTIIKERYLGLRNSELERTIDSAYNSNRQEFEKIQPKQVQSDAVETVLMAREEDLQSTPYFPEEAIKNLPQLFLECSNSFNCKRERDVFIVGSLGILSCCTPEVKGIYDNKWVYPNLYTFAVAPSANGKNGLNYARQLGAKYHEKLMEENTNAQAKYKLEKEAYLELIKSNNGKATKMEPPIEPTIKLLYIPANVSSARFIQHLKENNEQGVFCETEADSMANTLKQDWGGFSSLLRKAYHHEPESYSRKTNKEFIELYNPRLSVALAGTPDQVTGLIKSAQDGLFSRFLFYIFRQDTFWRDVSPRNDVNEPMKIFERASFKVMQLVEFCQQYPTTLTLSNYQWERLNATAAKWLIETSELYGPETESIIKRLGLGIYRTCMIFTAVDKYERSDMSLMAQCKEEHFDAALMFADVFRQHNLCVYHLLPKSSKIHFASPQSKKFFEAFPVDTSVTRKKAVEIGKEVKISEATVDNYLKRFMIDGHFYRDSYGSYRKNSNSCR